MHRLKQIRLFNCSKIWCPIIYMLVVLVTCFHILTLNTTKHSIDGANCFVYNYFDARLDSHLLDDILFSDHKPKKGKSIFFHETSCSQTGQLKLTARQACAIESAALLNPHSDVFVLFASPIAQSNKSGKINMNLQLALKSYTNIYLRNVDLWNYASGTPIYSWLTNGEIFNSNYLESHISDFLRFLTLWRWGGTYLDLDFVMIKSLENIETNYACAQSEIFIAAGVINLEHDGIGHQIAEMLLKDFEQNFNGEILSYNGPGVITRVIREICKTKIIKLMTRDRCNGFKVYGKEAFYAIDWRNWTYFFESDYLQKTLDLTNKSIGVHVWNKYSSDRVVKVGSQVAYGIYAQKYCPKVYNSCGSFF